MHKLCNVHTNWVKFTGTKKYFEVNNIVKTNLDWIGSSKAFEEPVITNKAATDVINLETASTEVAVPIQGALADASVVQPEPPKAGVDLAHTT